MINMHIDGLDRISASFITLQAMDEDTIWGMIAPAAELLKTRMQESIAKRLKQWTGSLAGSIEVRRIDGAGVAARVGPNNGQHPGSSTGKRKRRSQGGGGGSFSGTNAEIGWILEHGSSRIPGRHWMESACDETEEELYGILEAGFDAACTAAGF